MPLFALVLAWIFAVHAVWPAPPVVAAACERGCIVDSHGWVYEITRADLVWTARAAQCEIGSSLDTDDAAATMWALAQNFVRRHRLGIDQTWGGFVASYSACTSRMWATGGTRYSPRITPRADATRALRWGAIPRPTRDFVRAFFRGEYPNRWPGWVYVLTSGWEEAAGRRWLGPRYAVPAGRPRNAYYLDPATRWWGPDTVRVVVGITDP